MQTVSHHGRTTAYRVRGDGAGAPALFVHGSGGTHAVWKSQLARLAGDRPVAALDLSGHGESEDIATDSGPATLDAYARDVLAVADAVDARVLVGNSLGGAVVLTAVLDHDASPDAVVLAGSGAKLTVLDDLRDWLAGEDGDFSRAVEFLHGDDLLFHDPDDRELAFSKTAMRECGRAVVERDFLSCHTFDVRDRLGEVDVPVFALTGEYDRLTPPAFHEHVAEHVQDGAWTTVGDAAHLSMLEVPEEFNDALSEFLDSGEAPR
ncbi:alpha/beta fold hydrolase [Halobacterium jilantaiense]|uniref:Pimeloyl-ACP methyl ester carboxylesterase n=1 Tax=Halobacterium jilantaiense TaxID=355548 RepID=A0A1I0QR68_9EURY|nr:alpha/beta fold hydrolase [Halobacterium jilantaiense]SEW29667.1 Pimeloyl-ACP methyl ester carboxylesterase [Halobacterium jilantaiense]